VKVACKAIEHVDQANHRSSMIVDIMRDSDRFLLERRHSTIANLYYVDDSALKLDNRLLFVDDEYIQWTSQVFIWIRQTMYNVTKTPKKSATDCVNFHNMKFVETRHKLITTEFTFEASANRSTAETTDRYTYKSNITHEQIYFG
jgi:hypothetical protein